MIRTATQPSYARTVVDLDGTCTLSRHSIGGKAWSVNRMRALGLPVPPAFALTTDAWADHRARGRIDDGTWRGVVDGIATLERGTGRAFGGHSRPLLVSVRSGAAVSMPGMMDTVLNLGISAAAERALAAESGSAEYARDTRRRFDTQYREIVLGDPDATMSDDPWDQLRAAITAVFESWDSARARTYRRSRGVPDTLGTAVTVQAMVFGNLDLHSGTGVLFSRNPNTGARPAWGEWLVGGQGEDVVSGRTTPRPLSELAAQLPEVHRQLAAAAEALERDGRDIQDIEFTVESGALWLLQSRSAKRSARAALVSAVAMVDEGLIDTAEALSRVSVEQVRTVLRPTAGAHTGSPLATGESACPGMASGIAVSDPDEAEARGAAGEDVILVRTTTSPDDLRGMIGAKAVVTELGGATSHAALVSRELGRPCVVGCGAGTVEALVGQVITVDGSDGSVWPGRSVGTPVEEASIPELAQLREWTSASSVAELLAALEGPVQAHVGASAPVAAAATELDVLGLVAIKGRATVELIAESLGAAVDGRCEELVSQGYCATTPAGLRITPAGRDRLTTLRDGERAEVNLAAMAAAYTEFCEFNTELKAVITAWQMRDAATINDHSDAEYDGGVLAQLDDLHRRVTPHLTQLGAVASRLSRYRDRLARAVERVNAGDHSWVARPIIDSYHTVWFELHEDLIALQGLRRVDEAAAGRAQ